MRDFFQKIYEKITAKHPSVKILIVSWITFINSIPEIKIVNVLQDFLSALFNMLSEKQKEVNQSADKCLKDLLKELDGYFDSLSSDVEVKILEILINQCKSTHEGVLQTAFEWIYLFLCKYKYYILQMKKARSPFNKPSVANKHSNRNTGTFMSSVSGFSIVTIEDNKSDDISSLLQFNSSDGDRKIPFNLLPKILEVIINSINHTNPELKKIATDSNNELIAIIDFYSELQPQNTKIKLFEEILKNYLNLNEKETTLELVISWISKLFKKFHDEFFTKIDDFIITISSVLCHPNENIFTGVLEIMCDIAKYREENIEIILSIIFEKLCVINNLLSNKGSTIIKKFSTILPVDRVYSTFAEILSKMKETEFVQRMINILNLYLVTGRVNFILF